MSPPTDPAKAFDAFLFESILEHLTLGDLAHAALVSKDWNNAVASSAQVWRRQFELIDMDPGRKERLIRQAATGTGEKWMAICKAEYMLLFNWEYCQEGTKEVLLQLNTQGRAAFHGADEVTDTLLQETGPNTWELLDRTTLEITPITVESRTDLAVRIVPNLGPVIYEIDPVQMGCTLYLHESAFERFRIVPDGDSSGAQDHLGFRFLATILTWGPSFGQERQISEYNIQLHVDHADTDPRVVALIYTAANDPNWQLGPNDQMLPLNAPGSVVTRDFTYGGEERFEHELGTPAQSSMAVTDKFLVVFDTNGFFAFSRQSQSLIFDMTLNAVQHPGAPIPLGAVYSLLSSDILQNTPARQKNIHGRPGGHAESMSTMVCNMSQAWFTSQHLIMLNMQGEICVVPYYQDLLRTCLLYEDTEMRKAFIARNSFMLLALRPGRDGGYRPASNPSVAASHDRFAVSLDDQVWILSNLPSDPLLDDGLPKDLDLVVVQATNIRNPVFLDATSVYTNITRRAATELARRIHVAGEETGGDLLFLTDCLYNSVLSVTSFDPAVTVNDFPGEQYEPGGFRRLPQVGGVAY